MSSSLSSQQGALVVATSITDLANERKLAAMDDNNFSQAITPALQTTDPAFANGPPSLVRSLDSEDLTDNGAPKNDHSSAAQRVFAISELRDIIIEALLDVHASRISAVRDIAACAAVNGHWRRSVMDSTSIPVRIFHTAPKPDDFLFVEPDDVRTEYPLVYGQFPTIYSGDGPAGCLYVHRNDLQFNPVLDDVLVLSKFADGNFRYHDPSFQNGIYIYQNDLGYPCGGRSMVADIENTQDHGCHGCHQDDMPPLTYLKPSDLAEHKPAIERISSELMGWLDEHPVFADDFQPWTAADLVPPLFRNMFLSHPPVTEINVYLNLPHNDFGDRTLRCKDGVKIGHLIMILATHHYHMQYSSDIDGCLCKLDYEYPGLYSGYNGWRFDDKHIIEVYDFKSIRGGVPHMAFEVWRRWGDQEETTREIVRGTASLEDVLVDLGARWMADMMWMET